MTSLKATTVIASIVAAVLLGLVWLLLPPVQTADVVGMMLTVAVHGGVTLVLDRLAVRHGDYYSTVGAVTTAVLYWAVAVGTVLAWRVLQLDDLLLLLAVELVLLAVALAVGYGFVSMGKGREGTGSEHD